MTHGRWVRVLLSVTLLCLATTAAARADTWILIDTDTHTLTVLDGDSAVHTYENVSIGRNGAARLRFRADSRTPLGQFRINRISTDTRFHRFFGIDYPNIDHAERALRQGKIGVSDYLLIRAAVAGNHPPPPNTPLGGHIGIHGVGAGDPNMHASFDWTNGCVALTNEQIDALADYVQLGTVVVIR